jgi:hypothetical protein
MARKPRRPGLAPVAPPACAPRTVQPRLAARAHCRGVGHLASHTRPRSLASVVARTHLRRLPDLRLSSRPRNRGEHRVDALLCRLSPSLASEPHAFGLVRLAARSRRRGQHQLPTGPSARGVLYMAGTLAHVAAQPLQRCFHAMAVPRGSQHSPIDAAHPPTPRGTVAGLPRQPRLAGVVLHPAAETECHRPLEWVSVGPGPPCT